MVFPGLKKWAENNSWTVGKDRIYGEYNGYYFTAFDEQNLKCFVAALPVVTDEQKRAILSDLETHKKELGIGEFSLENSLLSVRLKEVLSPVTQEKMRNYLDHITTVLKEQKVSGTGHCFNCEQEVSTEKVLLNDILTPMCDDCYSKAVDAILQAERELETEDKNYPIGFLGALAGGIVGAIPWIIVSSFGWFVGWLGFLIGKAALKGYTLCKGRLGKATPWIIAGVTVFCVLLAEFVSFSLMIYIQASQEGIPFSLDLLLLILTAEGVPGEILLNVGIGIVIALVGISPLFKGINQEVKYMVPMVEKI